MHNLFTRYSRRTPVNDRRNLARGLSYQGFNQARPRVRAWYELAFMPSAASALVCVMILAGWSLSGGTRGTVPRAPLETKKPSEANAPSLVKEDPVIAPEIGSAQPHLGYAGWAAVSYAGDAVCTGGLPALPRDDFLPGRFGRGGDGYWRADPHPAQRSARPVSRQARRIPLRVPASNAG